MVRRILLAVTCRNHSRTGGPTADEVRTLASTAWGEVG
jgi:hypothetical protein